MSHFEGELFDPASGPHGDPAAVLAGDDAAALVPDDAAALVPDDAAELVPDDATEAAPDGDAAEAELVDAVLVPDLPVVAAQGEVEPARWSEHPTVQAAAAVATGFVAGAATLALMQRYNLRRVTRHVQDVRDALDPAGGRLPVPFPTGPGQTYLVHVRTVTAPPPQ